MSGTGSLVLYTTEDGREQIQFRAVDGTVWLTQAEIAARADPGQPNMALTTWGGSRVRKADVMVAKNDLNNGEMDLLNRLTTRFLDAAELRDQRREQTRMADWVDYTDRFAVFEQRRCDEDTVEAEREAEIDIDALTAASMTGRTQ